jgi:hypothetical protein
MTLERWFPDGIPPCAPDCSCHVSRYTTPAADALALMASELLDVDQAQSASSSEPGWEAYEDYSPLEIYQRESR